MFPKSIHYKDCHISKMVMSNLSQPKKGDFLVMINKSCIENRRFLYMTQFSCITFCEPSSIINYQLSIVNYQFPCSIPS